MQYIFKHILEAEAFKTAAVQPLTTYLTNHQRKTSEVFLVLPWNPTYGNTSVSQLARILDYYNIANKYVNAFQFHS